MQDLLNSRTVEQLKKITATLSPGGRMGFDYTRHATIKTKAALVDYILGALMPLAMHHQQGAFDDAEELLAYAIANNALLVQVPEGSTIRNAGGDVVQAQAPTPTYRAFGAAMAASYAATMQAEADPFAPKPAAKPAPAATADKTIAALRELLGSATDEARVVELITQHAPTATPSGLVITGKGRESITVDGHTHAQFKTVLSFLGSGLNIWLAGPTGSGKTTLAEQAATALGLTFYSTGAVASPFELLGFVDATGTYQRTALRDAFEHGGLFLWDEIDGSSPAALVKFMQLIGNGSYGFPDGMVEKHADFVCVASANTWGAGATADYVGRNRIDAATVDRFAQVSIDYDEVLEAALVGAEYADWAKFVQGCRANARKHNIRAVISPRATLQGAQSLADGIPRQAVIDALVRRSLDGSTWGKINVS